ncbi:unnamed protein product, partial [marine sediment metagenome]
IYLLQQNYHSKMEVTLAMEEEIEKNKGGSDAMPD